MTLADPQKEHGPGYSKYTWDNVMVRLDRIRAHGEHLSAEIQIEVDGFYFHGADRLSLTNFESRSKLAKHLTLMRNELDWLAMLSWAAQATLTKQRQGEPFVEVGLLPMRKGPSWLLEPILPLGHPTILFGEGGIGKSTIAELLGICVQTGWGAPVGLRTHVQGPVLFLDWEADAQQLNDNLMEFEAGLELDSRPRFLYRFCAQPLIDMVETVREEVFHHKVSLVIVDSAVPACGGAREARENAEPLFQALREFKTTSLIISHEVKDQLLKKRTPYGDVFFWNRARMVWHVRGDPESDESCQELGLWNMKANLMRRQKPWGLRLLRNELGNISAKRFSLEDSAGLTKHLSTLSQIQAALRTGPSSSQNLAQSLDINQNTISRTLRRYKDRHFVLLSGDVWGNQVYEPEE